MTKGARAPLLDAVRFGVFVLQPRARRLERDGVPVNLGSRALDILNLLVERSGEVVGHKELQERVWPNIAVEPNSLRVQMTALRKVLGHTDNGEPYIITIAGRGYCFVAPVAKSPSEAAIGMAALDAGLPGLEPLPRLKRLIGRERAVRDVVARLLETRFVTLAGTGGLGKTEVAVAVAHALEQTFGGAVFFLDLGEVTSPHAAHVMLGRAVLRRIVVAEGAAQGIADSLRDRRVLIVLDSCDHIAGAMGDLAAMLMRDTRDVHVLATSRRRLGGVCETVVCLPPLTYPDGVDDLPAARLAEYAAVRLLTHLIREIGHLHEPRDADVRALGAMTRQLDGLPLALQLAAASIAQNGIDRTASMIESRFALFIANPGATLPRHASLSATLEWSHRELTTEQRIVFRNLSVFSGSFTMDGVRQVAADAGMEEQAAAGAASGLLANSMIVQEAGQDSFSYRMLDTTRAFALSKLLTFGEADTVRRRHAEYLVQHLTQANGGAKGLSSGRSSEGLSSDIYNIRSALRWCFSVHGDTMLGARLASASAGVFTVLWLHAEGLAWLTQALASLDERCIGTQLELEIRFGIIMSANEPDSFHLVPAQLPRVIALADSLGSDIWRAEARAWECMLTAQMRPIEETVERAQRVRSIASSSGDYPTMLLGDWLLGLACHLQGAQHRVGPLCASAATLEFSTESIFFQWRAVDREIGRHRCPGTQPVAARATRRGAESRAIRDVPFRRHGQPAHHAEVFRSAACLVRRLPGGRSDARCPAQGKRA